MRTASPASIVILCVLLLLLPAGLSAQGTLVLREREAGRETMIRESAQSTLDGAILSSQSDSGDRETAWVDGSSFALRMQYSSPGAGSEFIAVREGDSLRVRGRIRGRDVDRAVRIDDRPWLCLVELCLGRYMRVEGAGTFTFWVLDSGTGEAHKLSAQRVGRENIQAAGGAVEAVRVRFTVPGIAPLFWSASWWFRASDGVFLRYEMPRGMPGTPKTVLELIGEE